MGGYTYADSHWSRALKSREGMGWGIGSRRIYPFQVAFAPMVVAAVMRLTPLFLTAM